MSLANPDGRQERKAVYEGVLRAVERNTGGRQPAGIRLTTLLANRCRAGDDREQVEKAIRAARENGDLIRWADHEGRTRLARTDDDSLLEVIEQEAETENPDQGLIGWCNDLRQQGGDER